MRAIEHITLATGHSRASPRSEVRNDIVGMIRPVVQAGGGPLWDTGFGVLMVETRHGGWVYDLSHGGVEAVRCYLAKSQTAAEALWSRALAEAEMPVKAERPTTRPWLAASLLPEGLMLLQKTPDLMLEFGDLERCVAWTILESRPDNGSG